MLKEARQKEALRSKSQQQKGSSGRSSSPYQKMMEKRKAKNLGKAAAGRSADEENKSAGVATVGIKSNLKETKKAVSNNQNERDSNRNSRAVKNTSIETGRAAASPKSNHK